MQLPTCVVCLCVKDVQKYVYPVFLNIMKLSNLFEIKSLVYFLDEGEDDTKGEITRVSESFSENFDPSLVSIITNPDPPLPTRTERIAHGRNALFNRASELSEDVEFMIMMDGDNISSGDFDYEKIAKYLPRNDWDCISFNREDYYDIWALCYEPFIHNMWGFTTRESCISVYHIMKEDISKELDSVPAGDLFECYSAFNGFAIYRIEKFLGCKYDGSRQEMFPRVKIMQYQDNLGADFGLEGAKIDFSKSSNCEHVSFHLQAIRENGARIRISSEIIF